MKRVHVKPLITTALCVAIGLILPYVTGHAFGMPGTILLPMHIPVLLCGLLCGPVYGAASGIIIPLLSSLLTGMPPVFPMLPIMSMQLLAMGLISGLCYRTLRQNIYVALVLSIAAGLASYAGMLQVLVMAGNESLRSMSVVTAVTQGFPGILIQLALIPILVKALEKSRVAPPRVSRGVESTLQKGIDILHKGDATCILIKNGQVIHTASGRGVSPLLRLYENQIELLDDAVVVDKIIGKAAAMILVLGRAKMVYGEVMSEAGKSYLESHGIAVKYGRCFDVISNRTRTGICPIEQSVLALEDPLEGLDAMKKTIRVLMQQAG